MWQLQQFDVEDFLADYWQRKPLLIRQALPGFSSIITPEELAGLACEEGVHSRLVLEKGGETAWQLRYGPFSEHDFTSLPMTHYSLLVSECEKWIPELQLLLDCFDFIPRWRIDDLMISYAPDQGSVGPHIDEYDVFLLQAAGQRRWSIENQLRDNPEIIPELDLAILETFDADQEWLLEPGDMLYLPPKIAHHGVAVGDGCMTYSVGFRAPAVSDIMDSLLLEASDQGLTDLRYSDPPLDRQRDPAEITNRELEAFRSLAESLLQRSTVLWPDVVGKLVTDSTLAEDIATASCDSIDEMLAQRWRAHPDTRMCYHATDENIRLYCNGRVLVLEPANSDNLQLCQRLCRLGVISLSGLPRPLPDPTNRVLLELVNTGMLVPAD